MAEKFKVWINLRFGLRCGTKIATRLFRMADRNRNQALSKEEFKKILRGLTDQDVDDIFAEMDINKNGTLELSEIIRVLRADMPEARIKVVRDVFKAADVDNDGVVSKDDLRHVLNVKVRQESIDGTKTDDELFEEFIQDLEPDAESSDGKITEEELIDYYSKHSPYYATDESFKLFIHSQWYCDAVSNALGN